MFTALKILILVACTFTVPVKKGSDARLKCVAEQEIEECSFKSPQGEEFKYSRDMNLQKGRITCLCKTEKYKVGFACGILVKNITDLDFGNWRCDVKTKEGLGAIVLPVENEDHISSCCKHCNTAKVDGQWGSWSSWSSCTKTCGEGNKTRTRNCDSPAPDLGGDDCAGDGSQSERCTNAPCQKSQVLLSDGGYIYYKVPVKHGERLVEGKVSETCVSNGMQAVCITPPGKGGKCRYTDTKKCLVTPLSMFDFPASCLNQDAFQELKAKLRCPWKGLCPKMDGLFMYMKNFWGGECGALNGKWCENGKDHVAGPGKEYYAFCVKRV